MEKRLTEINYQTKTIENDTIKFSVVIPLYNKEDTIARALQSVLDQTFQNFEIIVVDDGSTDKGPCIVDTFDDSRIRIIHQKNQGVSAARNRGITEAGNELIAFLDADDEWLPGFLMTIQQLIDAHPNCNAYGSRYLFGLPDGQTRPCLIRGLDDGFSGVLNDYFRIASRSDPPINSSSVVVRKTAINAVGGFPLEIKTGEDLLTWARLACLGQIAYTMHPGSIFWLSPTPNHLNTDKSSRKPDQLDQMGDALKELQEYCPMADIASLKAYIALWHKMRASSFLVSGMRFFALKEIWLSIKYFPRLKLFLYFCLLFIPKSSVIRLIRYNPKKLDLNKK